MLQHIISEAIILTRSDIQNFVYAQETQTAIRETLAEIIAIPSVSVDGTAPHVFGDATAAALDKMLEIGKQYGFACENHDYYCGSILLPGENPDDEIGIIAHIDVVPAVEGWEYPRFELTIDEEKGIFVGRGVRDDKGPAIMALTAMRFFQENNIRLPFSVRLILGCDEERGMDDLPHYLESHRPPRFSFSPDSTFPVCIGEKGIARLAFDLGAADGGLVSLCGGIVTNSVADRAEAAFLPEKCAVLMALALPEGISLSANSNGEPVLTALGKSAHAAEPHGSVNAILKLAQFILDSAILDDDSNAKCALTFLTAAFADNFGTGLDMASSDEITGKLTCICRLAAPADGHLHFDSNIRYPSSKDFAELFAKAEAVVKKAGYDVQLLSDSKGYVFSPDKAEILALSEAVTEFTGTEAKPYTMGGGTYARAFPNTVAFGAVMSENDNILGEGRGNAHERDEAIRIGEFNLAIEIFIRALANLAGL